MCIKRLFCNHNTLTFQYIISRKNFDNTITKISVLKCNKCDKLIYRPEKEEK